MGQTPQLLNKICALFKDPINLIKVFRVNLNQNIGFKKNEM